VIPQYDVALADFAEGMTAWRMWGRLGWQEIKRRYRRTVIGPFWTSLSLGIFIFVLGFVWAALWGQDPKTYLPFLCAGMLPWALVQSIINEGCTVFIGGESLIKQLRLPYSVLCCSIVWRNTIVFLHNLVIFVFVVVYAHVSVNSRTLLLVPGLALICLNGVWIATLFGLSCTRYRDIQQVVASLLQVLLFVTPIFFAPEQLGRGLGKRFVDFNVLYHYVDLVRAPLLGRPPTMWTWTVALSTTVIGWTVTLWIYSRFRRRIPYWL
jgi:homopolymeric O-antigen transport system permease protein